jgi:hypothetical protein
MKKEDLIKGLKDMADFYATHDMPLPFYGFDIYQPVTPNELVKVAMTTGIKPVDDGGSYHFKLKFDGITVRIYCLYERSVAVTKKVLDKVLGEVV